MTESFRREVLGLVAAMRALFHSRTAWCVAMSHTTADEANAVPEPEHRELGRFHCILDRAPPRRGVLHTGQDARTRCACAKCLVTTLLVLYQAEDRVAGIVKSWKIGFEKDADTDPEAMWEGLVDEASVYRLVAPLKPPWLDIPEFPS